MTIELSCLRSGFRGKARHLSETFLGSAVLSLLVLLLVASSWAQPAPETVNIQVQVDQSQGPLPPIWNFFGYDEPNYTYAPNGKKLLGELAALSPTPAYVRVHNLLTTGDGSSSLKWGSTNVYTEDAAGKPFIAG